jgi:hypothetical protein
VQVKYGRVLTSPKLFIHPSTQSHSILLHIRPNSIPSSTRVNMMQLRRTWRLSFLTNIPTPIARFGTKLEPHVILQIGRNTEQAIKDTRHFFTAAPKVGLVPHVELRIQNGPKDILLNVHGAALYRRTFRILRWASWIWYGTRYHSLTVHENVIPSLADALTLRVRWRLAGIKRWSSVQTDLVSGYSYYTFDHSSGDVVRHVVDRIVPPARGWLWWYIERGLWGRNDSLPAKPLVGTVDIDPDNNRK